MNLSREKIERAFVKVIATHRDKDPITLAEKMVDRLEYLMEDADEGFGAQPLRITREEPEVLDESLWRYKREMERDRERILDDHQISPENKKSRLDDLDQTPPLPKNSLVITPDHPEFRKAEKMMAEKQAPVRPVSVTKLGNPKAPAGKPVQYWTMETLIEVLHRETPAEILFTPNGMRETVKVEAVRNVQPLQGLDIVRLEYSSPQVSGDRMEGTDEKTFVIGLTATHTFNLYEQDLHISEAMDKILIQLKGLYRDRSRGIAEVALPPSPMDGFNYRKNPMGAEHSISMQDGWGTVGDPQGSALDSIVRSNRQHGGDPNKR